MFAGLVMAVSVLATSVQASDRYTCHDADFNRDRMVNDADLAILQAEFGQTGRHLQADINHDRLVDILDFGIFSNFYGQTCSR